MLSLKLLSTTVQLHLLSPNVLTNVMVIICLLLSIVTRIHVCPIENAVN